MRSKQGRKPIVDLSDEAIIERVQRGETELFEIIFERHFPRVDRYLRHLGVPDQDREDCAAETFARAFCRVSAFDTASGSRYVAYLYAIARNLAADRVRAWSRAPEFVALEDERQQIESQPSLDGDPLQAVLRSEETRRIRRAMEKLNPSDREMIYLSYERQLSSREIMAVTNKPSVTSVTTHLYKAMKKLRDLVLADEPNEERAVYDAR
jgi:RNA polymerase sigma-70 factor (ECF subfamily)